METTYVSGRTPASASAPAIARSWAGPFGAVRPALRPSWFTAVPAMYPITYSDMALSMCSTRTVVQDSERTYPLAEASSVLQRPSPLSIPDRLNISVLRGLRMAFTPDDIPPSHAPDSTSRNARWSATLEEEHAVSTATDEPLRLNRYERRPEDTLPAHPDAKYPSGSTCVI